MCLIFGHKFTDKICQGPSPHHEGWITNNIYERVCCKRCGKPNPEHDREFKLEYSLYRLIYRIKVNYKEEDLRGPIGLFDPEMLGFYDEFCEKYPEIHEEATAIAKAWEEVDK